jgi:predicted RNA-binding Zn ribbon-like protein
VPAHYVVVQGLELPASLGGHPALDFCNTRAGWNGHPQKEYLGSYEHLAVWAGFAGMLDAPRVAALTREARRRPKAAAAALSQALEIRDTLYRVLRDPTDPHTFSAFASWAHRAATSLRLNQADGQIQWEVEPRAGMAAPVLAVTWSAGQLLASPERAWVRACPGRACGWLFLHPTGRRRWCTMTTCGNREKARRFAGRPGAEG